MNVLDITDFKEKGKSLVDKIELAVKDTQRYVIKELPNVLEVTREQYEDLSNEARIAPMYKSNEQIYITKYNAMEVKIT